MIFQYGLESVLILLMRGGQNSFFNGDIKAFRWVANLQLLSPVMLKTLGRTKIKNVLKFRKEYSSYKVM